MLELSLCSKSSCYRYMFQNFLHSIKVIMSEYSPHWLFIDIETDDLELP